MPNLYLKCLIVFMGSLIRKIIVFERTIRNSIARAAKRFRLSGESAVRSLFSYLTLSLCFFVFCLRAGERTSEMPLQKVNKKYSKIFSIEIPKGSRSQTSQVCNKNKTLTRSAESAETVRK